jgi:hypothetical protein
LDASDSSLLELCELANRETSNPYAKYSYGHSLMLRDDPAGIDFVRAAYRLDKSFVFAGTRLIHNFQDRHGTHEQAISAWRTFRNAAEWTSNFVDNLWDRLKTVELGAISSAKAELLAEALSKEPDLDAAWAVSLQSREVGQRTMRLHVFVLRVVPDEKSSSVKKEEALIARTCALAGGLFPPNELVRALVFYSTEPIDPKLYDRLRQTRGAEIIAPTRPVNKGIIKFDSV